ncbi:hypothetical protein FACS1894130_06820 [Spirochaetia bacterium]|nr:hypothetical protein FACS1894130_06820 [Spirochaetia bacterium]
MGYYYLAAQLPSLVYGQAAPMGSAAFTDLCRSALSEADAALLDLCTLDPAPFAVKPQGSAYAEPPVSVDPDFIDSWRNWERTLRLNLARYRTQKIKREGGAPVDPPDYPADAAGAAKAAAALDSPLEAELFLDKARWDAIDAFQGLDYFSRNTIYAYLLKLLLMERRALFRVEEGFSEYKGLYAAILTAAGGSSGETSFGS